LGLLIIFLIMGVAFMDSGGNHYSSPYGGQDNISDASSRVPSRAVPEEPYPAVQQTIPDTRRPSTKVPERPSFTAGGLYCREPSVSNPSGDAGEACWCMREFVRSEIYLFYASKEVYMTTIMPREVGLLCKERLSDKNAVSEAAIALYPEGLGFLAGDIAVARAVNPFLVRSVPPREFAEGVRKSLVMEAQKALNLRGFDPGPEDGYFGARTEAAVKDFQAAVGLPVTGHLDTALLALLRYSLMVPNSADFGPDGK
jgi:hypothetical protein